MKKEMKLARVLSVLLIVCIAFAGLAACSSKEKSNDATTTTAIATTAEQTKEVIKEPKELRIGMSSKGRPQLVDGIDEYIDDNWSTKYIIDNFGKPNNIDIKFEIIDDTDGKANDNYQLLMASKSAPDLYFSTSGRVSFPYGLAEAGALADLWPSIEKYGSNIISFLGEDFIKQYGTMFGKIHTIPGRAAVSQISDSWIRKDWLDQLGLQVPANFDEYYTALKAFKDRASELEKAGLVKSAREVIPYGHFHMKYYTPWERLITRFYPTEYFDSTNEKYYIYSGYGTEYMKEGFKEGFQFLNKMYNEGLISQNFAIDQDKKQFFRDIINGNTGAAVEDSGFIGSLLDPESRYSLLRQNIPQATFVQCLPFNNKYDNVVRNPGSSDVMTYIFVPVYSTVVDEAIQYLDFVSQRDHMITIMYGIEGVSYKMDKDLGPVSVDKEAIKKWGHALVQRPLIMLASNFEDKWTATSYSGAFLEIEDRAQALNTLEMFNKCGENAYQRFPTVMQVVPEKTFENALKPIWEKFCVTLMSCKPKDYEKAWADGVKELEANGSLKIVEGRKREFEKIKHLLK